MKHGANNLIEQFHDVSMENKHNANIKLEHLPVFSSPLPHATSLSSVHANFGAVILESSTATLLQTQELSRFPALPSYSRLFARSWLAWEGVNWQARCRQSKRSAQNSCENHANHWLPYPSFHRKHWRSSRQNWRASVETKTRWAAGEAQLATTFVSLLIPLSPF